MIWKSPSRLPYHGPVGFMIHDMERDGTTTTSASSMIVPSFSITSRIFNIIVIINVNINVYIIIIEYTLLVLLSSRVPVASQKIQIFPVVVRNFELCMSYYRFGITPSFLNNTTSMSSNNININTNTIIIA
jgi:hypothetical protein